jgi:hypothetical protein
MVASGVIAAERAISDFHKEKSPEGDDILTISVGRNDSLPTVAEKHDFGCRTAVKANEGMEQRKGAPLARPDETVHYRGCFSLSVAHIQAAPRRHFEIWVEPHPIDGLDEHCNVVMKRNNGQATKSQLSAERTSILVHLRLGLYSPMEHICDCDADLIDLIGAIRLVAAPERLKSLGAAS